MNRTMQDGRLTISKNGQRINAVYIDQESMEMARQNALVSQRTRKQQEAAASAARQRARAARRRAKFIRTELCAAAGIAAVYGAWFAGQISLTLSVAVCTALVAVGAFATGRYIGMAVGNG